MPLSTSRLGFYEVISPIGYGGMSEVYKARDTRLNRIVALKILPPGFASDPDRKARFIREAQAASALSSPYVAHIYEVGEEEGLHYIAMEYVEGKGLNHWTEKKGKLPVAQIQELAIQITEALQEAHLRGITHRDIKPQNIMLTSSNRVKILDFGLAKVVAAEPDKNLSEADTMAQTKPGIVMGTIQYLSPEQALAKEVDSRTDLFSLGIVIYQLVTGRLPFNGASVTEILDRILHDTPEAVSRFNYNVSPDLDRIIRKCLEKDRDRRYQSAQELLIDLKNLKRDSESGKVKPVRRTIPLRAAILSLVVLLAAVAAYVLYPRAAAFDSLAILPFENVGKEDLEVLSDGFTEGLITDFSRSTRLKVMARATVFSFKGKPVEPMKIGKQLNIQAVLSGNIIQKADKILVEAELVNTGDGSRMWAQNYEGKSRDLLSIQQEVVRSVSTKLGVNVTDIKRTNSPEAYQAYLTGRYHWDKRTAEGLQKAFEYFNQAIQKDPNYAAAYAGLADTYYMFIMYEILPMQEAIPKCRAAALKAIELDDSLAEAHISLAVVYDMEWNFTKEEEEYKRAIELGPANATAHQWYAELLMAKGRLREALSQINSALEIDPLSMTVNNMACHILYFAGEYDAAIERCNNEVIAGENNDRLGQIYAQKKMWKESIEEYQKAVPNDTLIADEFATLGYDTAVRNAYQRFLERHLKRVQDTGEESSETFADLYAHLGNNDQAFYWIEKSFQKRSPTIFNVVVPIRYDPELRKIRTDPRFADLLKRMGLPPP